MADKPLSKQEESDVLNVYSYRHQLRAVIAIELALICFAGSVAYFFWTRMCETGLAGCLADGPIWGPLSFIILAIVRPFVFTPVLLTALIAGKNFGPVGGTILTVLGAMISCLIVFGIAKYVGRKMAKPWLRANLPATVKFIRSQDYKLVFAIRLIPLVPFDLASFLFGALDFRTKSVFWATMLGCIPEAYLYAKMLDPSESVIASTITTLIIFAVCVLTPLIAFEFYSRKRGTSMWQLLRAMYREIVYEVHTNNDIVKRHDIDPAKTPVLLVYGFFSSRRSMTVLERMLSARGHQVFSFNLGGLLGTFFTRGILDTANFIDYKIKRQIERHGFENIQIVAHSKGGLVALWWVLKLGGAKYCKQVITMGTPFRGTMLTYLALVTPLGFFWRDVWQMRPGSMFLKSLTDVDIPDDMHIHCFYSRRDKVAKGKYGLFEPRPKSPNVHAVPMNHIGHFEFLYRRDVADAISSILKTGETRIKTAVSAENTATDRSSGGASS